MQTEQVYDISEIYRTKSNFLKAADLKGRRPVVTISGFELGTVGDEKRPQIIISFEGTDKKLGLNKTNAERLWVLSGSKNPADWVGGKIRLFVDPSVEFQGKKVDAIRISQEFWEAPPGKPEPDPEGWNQYPPEDNQNDDEPPF